MYCGPARLCVCLSAAVRPHYCTDLDVTWGHGSLPPSCALLGGFAIGTRVALLWQHTGNVCIGIAFEVQNHYIWLPLLYLILPALIEGGTSYRFILRHVIRSSYDMS